jgi:hypothetical protein
MKKNTIIKNSLCLLLLLNVSWEAVANTSPCQTANRNHFAVSAALGTTTIEELSMALFSAIRAADIDAVDRYLLSENELATLKERSSPELKALLMDLEAGQIRGQFKQEYAQMISKSVNRRINWAEMTLTETMARKETNQDQTLFPVEMKLRNRANEQFKVIFDAVKLDGRYFLFRRLALQ